MAAPTAVTKVQNLTAVRISHSGSDQLQLDFARVPLTDGTHAIRMRHVAGLPFNVTDMGERLDISLNGGLATKREVVGAATEDANGNVVVPAGGFCSINASLDMGSGTLRDIMARVDAAQVKKTEWIITHGGSMRAFGNQIFKMEMDGNVQITADAELFKFIAKPEAPTAREIKHISSPTATVSFATIPPRNVMTIVHRPAGGLKRIPSSGTKPLCLLPDDIGDTKADEEEEKPKPSSAETKLVEKQARERAAARQERSAANIAWVTTRSDQHAERSLRRSAEYAVWSAKRSEEYRIWSDRRNAEWIAWTATTHDAVASAHWHHKRTEEEMAWHKRRGEEESAWHARRGAEEKEWNGVRRNEEVLWTAERDDLEAKLVMKHQREMAEFKAKPVSVPSLFSVPA